MIWAITGKNFGSYYVEQGVDCVVSDPSPFLMTAWPRQHRSLAKRGLSAATPKDPWAKGANTGNADDGERLGSPYRAGRVDHRLKVKYPDAPAA